MWKTLVAGNGILYLSVAAALGSMLLAGAALWFTAQAEEYNPIQHVTLDIVEGTTVAPNEAIPMTLYGCVEKTTEAPLVLLTLFSGPRGDTILGPTAIALAEEGCRETKTKVIVPLRAGEHPGEWRLVLLTFAQGPIDSQITVVTSPPFMVNE